MILVQINSGTDVTHGFNKALMMGISVISLRNFEIPLYFLYSLCYNYQWLKAFRFFGAFCVLTRGADELFRGL